MSTKTCCNSEVLALGRLVSCPHRNKLRTKSSGFIKRSPPCFALAYCSNLSLKLEGPAAEASRLRMKDEAPTPHAEAAKALAAQPTFLYIPPSLDFATLLLRFYYFAIKYRN
eukprot:Hpha_TRINITY_DN35675_c0_g1::TRINITY_DN35675_c0_g1_i1::g.68546::m.68546